LAVADGMGGRNFGEIARLLALRTGWELGGDEIKWSMKMNDNEVDELKRKAEALFRLIDHALHVEARDHPRLAGMGTTFTVCYSTGDELFVVHAGDSRAYRFRGGVLRQLTRDNTLARWAVHLQNDFKARMDWCVADRFEKANHRPVAVLNGDATRKVLRIKAKSGETVRLTSAGSSDPDR
ncbi:hypothetical protein B4Q13_23370, partial [Lacticaseibacillus rhamnosus]